MGEESTRPVAADPDFIVRLRQVGHQEAAAIVGEDNLDEIGQQIFGLCDDPDAGFRTAFAAHGACDETICKLVGLRLPTHGKLTATAVRVAPNSIVFTHTRGLSIENLLTKSILCIRPFREPVVDRPIAGLLAAGPTTDPKG